MLGNRTGTAGKGWRSGVAGAMRAVTQSPMARPASIRERFTIGISPNGTEAQRPLAEMTAAEVLAALRGAYGAWQREVDAEPKPFDVR